MFKRSALIVSGRDEHKVQQNARVFMTGKCHHMLSLHPGADLQRSKYMSTLVISSKKLRSFVRESSRNVWKAWPEMYFCKILIQYIS